MQISGSLPRNPYAAFELMTRRGAMGEERGPLERRPGAGIRHAAPTLQNQLVIRLQRYENLGDQSASLRSALATAPPSTSGESAREGHPEALEIIREWSEKTNAYLRDLDRRTQDHPHGELKAFRLTIAAMLRQERALSDVGLSVENGTLRLDEAAFRGTLEARPEAALGALHAFRETLDPLLAAQGHALEFMRGLGEAVRARIPEISQAQVMRFKLEARGKEIGLWLSSLEKLAPTLSEQTEKLRELGRSEQDEPAAPKGSWPPADAEKPRIAKEDRP